MIDWMIEHPREFLLGCVAFWAVLSAAIYGTVRLIERYWP